MRIITILQIGCGRCRLFWINPCPRFNVEDMKTIIIIIIIIIQTAKTTPKIDIPVKFVNETLK